MTHASAIEIEWVLQRTPQVGAILDIGSCGAKYISALCQPGREVHCLDARDCRSEIPDGVSFHHENLIGNALPRGHFDTVIMVSSLAHIGLPCYGLAPFPRGDELALAEVRSLLRPGGTAILTVPAGQSKVTTWYRQYSAIDLRALLRTWKAEISYWGYDGTQYVPVSEEALARYDYRDRGDDTAGPGAIACVQAQVARHVS